MTGESREPQGPPGVASSLLARAIGPGIAGESLLEPELPIPENTRERTRRLLDIERATDGWFMASQRQEYEARDNYAATCEALFERIAHLFLDVPTHRIHGDCHFANLIYRPDHVIVLDPTLVGPAITEGLRDGGFILINSPEPPASFAANGMSAAVSHWSTDL